MAEETTTTTPTAAESTGAAPKKKTTTKKASTTAAKKTTSAKASTADKKKTSAAPKKTTKAKKDGATTMETFMDHQKQALAEARKALESFIPVGLKEHSTNAFNESLEGYRKLFNSMIDEVKANADKVRSKVGRGEKSEASSDEAKG